MIVSTETAVEMKRCTKCCQVKPITSFCRKRKGQPALRDLCNQCKTQAAKDLYWRKKFKRDGNAIAANNRALKGAATIEQVRYLQSRMIGIFGGLENFAAAQESQAKAELKRNLGGRRSSDIFAAAANGYTLCKQENAIDLTGLDAGDAAEKLTKVLVAIYKESPAEARAGMVRAGWPDTDAIDGTTSNGHSRR